MRQETYAASTAEETAAEAEKTARRRSTGARKSQLHDEPPPDTAPAMPGTIEPAAPAPAPAETGPAESGDQPRKPAGGRDASATANRQSNAQTKTARQKPGGFSLTGPKLSRS